MQARLSRRVLRALELCSEPTCTSVAKLTDECMADELFCVQVCVDMACGEAEGLTFELWVQVSYAS